MADIFSVNIDNSGDVCVLTTHGYINNHGGEEIAAAYRLASENGYRKFLLNLADSHIVNSIGISVLIEILEQTLEKGGCLAFCECLPIVTKTFQIMGLTQYANMYATQSAALEKMLKL
jgi:anti-anti-sigma factor